MLEAVSTHQSKCIELDLLDVDVYLEMLFTNLPHSLIEKALEIDNEVDMSAGKQRNKKREIIAIIEVEIRIVLKGFYSLLITSNISYSFQLCQLILSDIFYCHPKFSPRSFP